MSHIAIKDQNVRDFSELMAPQESSSATRAGLILLHGPPGIRTAYPFRRDRVLLGRDPDVDLQIADAAVSRRHAVMEHCDGAWVLRDLGSKHGTFVDGRRVAEALLDASQILRFGGCLFRFSPAEVEGYARHNFGGDNVRPLIGLERVQPGSLVGGYRMQQGALTPLQCLVVLGAGVVILGERGTQKARYARKVHTWRGRRGPFSSIDGASSLWSTLADLDLEDGTLFLDNADHLTPEDVAALRLSFQGRPPAAAACAGPYRSQIGARGAGPADVIVGLCHADRPAAHLATPEPAYTVTIPPLRERKEDLRAHARQILHELGRPDVALEADFMLALVHHDFPGDVQELEEILMSGAARAEGKSLGAAHLPTALRERLASLYAE